MSRPYVVEYAIQDSKKLLKLQKSKKISKEAKPQRNHDTNLFDREPVKKVGVQPTVNKKDKVK